MLTRLTHAAIAFAATVVVYQAYVVVAVPFLEPSPPGVTSQRDLTPEEIEQGRQPQHKYRELLAAYFPAGHWTRTKPPITFESGKAMFVLDLGDYRPRDDGQVRVYKCAILFFPRARVRGEPPPRDAVVLEAPHGAVLQMDGPLRVSSTGMSRLQRANLLGEITIRSDMREPGPEDDLLLTTRDLYMNEDLIRTDDRVNMRLGPHWGRGKVLEIRLVAVERGSSSDAGPNLGGIDSLEILQDVEAELVPKKGSGVFVAHRSPVDQAIPPKKRLPTPFSPVKITSQGRFQFNFAHNTASFEDRVQLEQVHADGQLDRLRCEELTLYFANGSAASAANPGFDIVDDQKPPDNKLRPGSIRAAGTVGSPVVLDAPSRRATARCEQLWIELDSQRVTFDDEDEVVLTYDGNEIHAPLIQYQAPPQGSAERIGTLLAAGSGWIRAVTGDGEAVQPFEARWTREMRLARVDNEPILSLRGRPRLTMAGMGQLWADDLDVYLRQRAADGSEDQLLPADVVPRRVVARGHIDIDSGPLRGKVNQLEVRIDYAPSELLLTPPTEGTQRSRQRRLGQLSDRRSRAYDIVGDRLQMLLTVRDRQPEVTSIDVERDVVFRETSTADVGNEPLVVEADHLRVEHADTPAAEITLSGRPATVTAAGMSIRANALRLNRGESRAWIDSPGEMELPVDRDLSGKPLPVPQPLSISWQGGMELNDDTITFRKRVVATTGDGVLETEQLVAKLSAPVRFDGAAGGRQVELEQIGCEQGVRARFNQRDAMGLTSKQVMTLESFTVNQRTGQIAGSGPGSLESVHLTSGANALGMMAAARRGAQPKRQRLQFLRVDFLRHVAGNLHDRRIQVSGNAQAVYGPVDSWEQRLQMSVHGAPEPETIWISGQELGIAQSPLARMQPNQGMGPVELSAHGDVTIEGRYGERGTFTTRSDVAHYDQSKTTFRLESSPPRMAQVIIQQHPGALHEKSEQRVLTYNHVTRELSSQGFGGGAWKQIDLGRQPPREPSR